MNRSPDSEEKNTFILFPNESLSYQEDKNVDEDKSEEDKDEEDSVDEDENEGIPVANLIETDGLVEEWWRTFNIDSVNGLKEIIELLYHSTGWKSFTFYNELDEDAIRKHIKKQDDVTFVNPTVLNWNFIDRFGVFFEEILEKNNGQLLQNESFIRPIINSCLILKTGLWTSYRMIAVVAGMRIMSSLQNFNEAIILELSAPELPDFCKADLRRKKETAFNLWRLLYLKVFKLSIRDVISEVRRVAINEMLTWASKNPAFLLDKRWQKYLYLALRDTNPYNRDLAYNMVHYLFINEIDQTKQSDLFQCLKIELFFALQNMEGIPPFKSICVCTNLAKYIDKALNKDESFSIYSCVYHKSQIIAFKAAEYLMMQLLTMVNTRHALIKHIIIFNMEGMVHIESLLMDVLYYFIHPILSWDDWFTYIAGCTDKNVEQTVAMFFAYAHKAVEGYTPPSRIKCKELQMKKNVLIQNRAKFTKSLGHYWIELINMNKILKFPEALIRIIKILQFTGLQLSPEVITEICKKLSDTFLTSNEKRIVSESCKSMQHLLNVAGTSRTDLLTSVQKQLVDKVLAEFMDYIKVPLCTLKPGPIHNRIVYLCQSFDFDDQLIWNTCKNNLLNASINKYSDELIIVLMSILCSRLFYYLNIIMELYSKENNADEDNSLREENDDSLLNYSCDNSYDLHSARNLTKTDLVNKINSRASEVHDTIKIFLNCKFSYPVNIMAFKIMATFIEYFGPHIFNHSTMWEFVTNIDEDVESGMVDIVEAAFQNDCPSKSHSDTRSTLGECCQIVKRYCNLLGEGILDWKKASKIIILIKENKWHGDYIANCINIFIKNFPKHFNKPGIAVYNAVATSVKLEEIKRSSRNELDSAKNILEELFISRRINYAEGDLICFLHEMIIKQAYAKDGFKPLIKLVYPLRSILRNDDIPKILQLLNKFKNQYHEQLTQYKSILQEGQRYNK